MATLNGAINASTTSIRVTGSGAIANRLYRLDDEVIKLRGFARYPRPWSARDTTRWEVERGANGSTAASHSNGVTVYAVNPETVVTGASLTPPAPFPTGGVGGSISATDGTTTVDPATSIQFPAGTLSDGGGGVAQVGVSQTVSLYKYDLHGDDFAGDPVPLRTFSVGETLVKAWCVVEYPWDGSNNTLIVGWVDQNDSVQGVIYYNLFQPAGYDVLVDLAVAEPLPVLQNGDPGGYAQSLVVLQETPVVAYAPASGASSLVHIYLLVATPSS